TVTRIEVPPIAPFDVEELLADALSMPRDAVRDLASLVHARTGGNPFFLRIFVKTLVEDGALRFGPNGWAWSMTELRERGVTENIAKVLSNQIRRLPNRTHTLLELAACLGSQFPLETLRRVEPRLDLETDLWPAIDAGYLIPAGYIHSPADLSGPNLESSLRFAHDRVREAILGRLPPPQREALHRQIASALANHPQAAEGPMLFELVGQLNQSGDPPSPDERLERARLNLLAATRSIAASSAQRALSYATTGIDLLRQGGNAEPLRHELQTTACEAAFSCGKFDTFTDLAQQALSQSLAPLEEAKILGLAGHVAYARGDGLRALETYLRALTSLSFWPAEPLGSQAEVVAICALSDERILSLPACTDARALLGMELLDPAILTAFYAGSAELPALLNLCCGLTLRFGLTPYSAFAITILGVLELGQNRFESAMRLAQLALAIAERFGNDEISSRILLYTHYQLLHRRLPLRDQVSPLRRAYQFGAKAGSAFNAACAAATLCIVRFLAGAEELRSLTRDMAAFADRVRLLRQNQVLNWHEPYEQTVWNLVQDTPEPTRLHGPVYDERERSGRHLANNDAPALFNLRFCKAYLAYLFGDFQEAYRVSRENAGFLQAVAVHTLMIGPALLLDALSRLAVAAELSPEERDAELQLVRATLQTFERLRSECASNSQHKYHLIAAELARVEGRHEAARDHFTEAMSAASRSGNYAEEALTHEVSARFFLASRDPEAARAALRTAHDAYLRWGATTKVKMLEGEHPNQLPNLPWGTLNTSTLATIHRSTRDFNWLDVLSALHASQTISREMSVDRLIVSLMDLVVGTAGAELGYLFVNQADGWVVQADKPGPQEPSVLVPLVPLETHALTKSNGLPTSILQHVIATKEPLVLDDAATHEVFGYDSYVASRSVKSVLCFPLLRQGELVCAVYLENNLVRTAFSPSRVLILEFLAGQALISLENARLYATLEQKVQQRTQQLRRKNEELAQTLDQLKEAQNCIIVQDRLASLGAMTAGLAHELRNPLNFVQNFARLSLRGAEQMISRLELLGATPTNDHSAAPQAATALQAEVPALLQSVTRMKGNLEKVTLHGDRIDGLIRSMLDHSRSNTGPRRDTDINALLETYANLAQHGSSTQDARLNVVLELDRTIEPLPIVPQELGRVFLNLIDNARYATHKKALVAGERDYSPTLRLSTRNCGAHVEIRVRDNGTGVEKSVQSRIFDPFFTTKPTGQGTGLGLSISHDIVVQANGGSLRFESEEGEYTEFIIALPKRPVAQSATGRSP
ncbi:MAG TPA: ATP-binding protein, partial [Polyangiaceae bacterium]|nr:ATP-binding protein [Polyangiaceae bacterium]